jgi:hypothetical protein
VISIPSNARTSVSSPNPTSENVARAALPRLAPSPPPPTHRVPADIPLARPPTLAHRLATRGSIARVTLVVVAIVLAHRVARAIETLATDARRASVAAAAAADMAEDDDVDAARASRRGVAHRVNMRGRRDARSMRSVTSRRSRWCASTNDA